MQRVAALLAGRAQEAQKIKFAIAELHRVPKARKVSSEFNPIYLQLLGLYRKYDYIGKQLEFGKVGQNELEVFERVVTCFIEIAAEIERGEVNLLLQRAKDEVEQNLPYARFYAGVFAFARGDTDGAFGHFAEAANLWKVKAEEIAELIASEPAAAEKKLGRKFEVIKRSINSSPFPAATAEPVRPEKIPRRKIVVPEAATTRRENNPRSSCQEIVARAQETSNKGRHFDALRLVTSALEIDSNHAGAIEAQAKILQFIYSSIARETNLQQKAAKIKTLLETKPDEVAARLILVETLTAKGFARGRGAKIATEEALEHVRRAKEEVRTDEERSMANFLEASCLFRLFKNREALNAFKKIAPDDPYFNQTVKGTLILLTRLKRQKEGFAFLEQIEGKKLLADYEILSFNVEFMALAETVEELDKAYDEVLRVKKLANQADDTAVVKRLSTLLNEVIKRLSNARAEKAAALKAEEAEKAPPPAVKPEPAKKAPARPIGVRPVEVKPVVARPAVDSQKELEAFRAQLISWRDETQAAFDRRDADLQAAWQELATAQEELAARQTSSEAIAAPRRREVEVSTVSVHRHQPTLKEREIKQICALIVKGEYDEALAKLQLSGETGSKGIITTALTRLLSSVLENDVAVQIELKPKEEQSGAAYLIETNRTLIKERRDLRRALAEAKGRAERLRRANEALGGRVKELAQELASATAKPIDFDGIWEELSQKNHDKLTEIDPVLSDLFVAEVGRRGRALSAEEIFKRRRFVIETIVGRIQAGESATSTYFMKENKKGFSMITNKRVFPNGYTQARNWAEAILDLISSRSE